MSVTMHSYKRALTTGTAGASLADKTTTATKPVSAAGIHVYDLALSEKVGMNVPRFVDFVPIVGDADGETGTFRIWAWNRIEGTSLWHPKLLVHLACTATDSSAALVDAATTPFYCDTITVSYGDANAQVISPGNDAIASVVVATRGAELLEFDFVVGTGANVNLMYRMMDQ